MPLPRDLAILRPRWSRTVPLMTTSVNGSSPMNSRPIITIRATQKKMISEAVTSVFVG
jgi:hypothetical protein